MLSNINKIVRIGVVAILTKVGFIFCRGISLAVLCIMHKRSIGKEDKIIASALLRSLHEIFMTCTFPPVIALAVKGHICLSATLIGINICTLLLQRASTKVYSPDTQADTHRITGSICLLGKQIVRNLPFGVLIPKFSDEITAPCISRTEELYCLKTIIRIDCNLLLSSGTECKKYQ